MPSEDRAAPETQADQPGTAVAPVRKTASDWLATQTGVNVTDTEGGRMISLSRELAQRVNLLTPISQIVQLDRNWTPVPRIVHLQPGVDTYKQGYADGEDVHALRATGLRKIADLMGIEHVNTTWSTAPDTQKSIKATVTARLRGPDGLFKYATKAKTIRFEEHQEKLVTDAREKFETFGRPNWEKAKAAKAKDPGCRLQGALFAAWKQYGPNGFDEAYARKLVLEDMEHLDAKCETKAWNRAIRDLAKITGYKVSELAKPFLTVTYSMTPDYSDPNVVALVELQYRRGSLALYDEGSQPSIEPPREGPALPAPGESFIGTVDDEEDEEDFDDDEPEGDGDVVDGAIVGEGHDVPLPDEEPEDWGDEQPPEPPREFKIGSKAPKYAGMSVREVVASGEGRQWLVAQRKRLRDEDKRALWLAWISWGEGRVLTDDDDLDMVGVEL